MLTTLKLLAAAGLGAAYLAVAFMAKHPRVDAEYDAHYLHRSANCWVPLALRSGDPAPLPPVIEIGKIGYPETCRFLRWRWYYLPEAWGAWSLANSAKLQVPRRPGARAVELTVRTAPPPNPAIPVRFVLNGHVTEEEIPPGTTTTIDFPLPPEGEAYNPEMNLSFGKHGIVPIDPSRRRRNAPKESYVGIGLIAIRYLPEQPVPAATGG